MSPRSRKSLRRLFSSLDLDNVPVPPSSSTSVGSSPKSKEGTRKTFEGGIMGRGCRKKFALASIGQGQEKFDYYWQLCLNGYIGSDGRYYHLTPIHWRDLALSSASATHHVEPRVQHSGRQAGFERGGACQIVQQLVDDESLTAKRTGDLHDGGVHLGWKDLRDADVRSRNVKTGCVR